MPYKLRKAPKRELYWVVNTDSGKKHSIEPIPRDRAQRQMNLLRGIEHGFKPTKGYRSPVKGGGKLEEEIVQKSYNKLQSLQEKEKSLNHYDYELNKEIEAAKTLYSSAVKVAKKASDDEKNPAYKQFMNKLMQESNFKLDEPIGNYVLQGGKKSPKKDCCEELKIERRKRKLLEDEYIGDWK